jgi:hypothetical protein
MNAYEFAIRNGLLPRLRNHGNEAYVVSERQIHSDPGLLQSARQAGLVEHARRNNVVLLYAAHPSDKGITLKRKQREFITKWDGKEIGCNPNEHGEWTYLRRRAWIVRIPQTRVVNFEADAKSHFEIGWKLKREQFTEFLLFSKAGLDNVVTTLEMARGAKSAFEAIRMLQNNVDVRKIQNLPTEIEEFVLESRKREFEMGLVAWLAFTGAEALLKAQIIQHKDALEILTEGERKTAEKYRKDSNQVFDYLSFKHLGLTKLKERYEEFMKKAAGRRSVATKFGSIEHARNQATHRNPIIGGRTLIRKIESDGLKDFFSWVDEAVLEAETLCNEHNPYNYV